MLHKYEPAQKAWRVAVLEWIALGHHSHTSSLPWTPQWSWLFKVWLLDIHSHPLSLWTWKMGAWSSCLHFPAHLPGDILCTLVKPYRWHNNFAFTLCKVPPSHPSSSGLSTSQCFFLPPLSEPLNPNPLATQASFLLYRHVKLFPTSETRHVLFPLT